MLRISDDNRNSEKGEETGTRLIGIPNAPTTCFSIHHHHQLHPDHVAVGSPVNRVPSSSSSVSLPNPYSELSSSRDDHRSTKLWLNTDSNSPSLSDNKLVDDLRLANDFSRMNIGLFDGNQTRGYNMDPYANVSFFNETGTLPYQQHVSDNAGVSTSLSRKGYTFGPLVESSIAHDHTNQMYHHMVDQRRKQQQGTSNFQLLCDRYMASQNRRGVECEASWMVKNPYMFSQMNHSGIPLNHNSNVPSHYYSATKEKACVNTEHSHSLSPWRVGGDHAAFRCDNSIIIQGKDVKHCFENGYDSLRGYRRSPREESAIQVVGENVYKNFSSHAHANDNQFCENNITAGSDFSLPMLLNFYSLAEVPSYIYNMAKDQNGCRLLQRMVDEGTYEHMCMVFEGIISSVVELMMDSFGNYLVQKLLDVCSEDQRLQIVLMLTKEPGQLVRISLNTHGTRVVQKLIETLNSAKQISLVKSAIQPGFLDLIKDLNGNHVIQRCLQRLSCQDNQFIFEAAVKYCVEIATHRHGCCVLQRCIDHSQGKHQDKLVNEICKHGLLLAQDPFGNYVVQYIIEMDYPTVSAKLLGQFKGNFINLSTQKFSSHVVEKCLKHIGDSKSKIVRELLSAPHFEQLLQDPYANYVIQSALSLTKGSLHASLVEAIRTLKVLRTSPYCKRIFSGNLLKK